MRQKHRRTSLRAKPILVLLLIVSITVGLLYSKLTSAVHARVDGVANWDEARLAQILDRRLRDVPCAQVRPREVESEAMEDPEVRSAELTRNVFGRALLTVHYRRPVARIRNTNNLALTIDGVLYPSHGLPETLPVLQLPAGEPRVQLTIAGNWQLVRLAELAARTTELWPREPLLIDVDDRGSVCLNKGSARVVLGSTNDFEKKLSVLQERLRKNPSELDSVVELNLLAPETPAVIRKRTKTP